MPTPTPPTQATRRNKAAVALLAVVLAIVASACLTPEQAAVRDAMNRSRGQHRLSALPDHPALNAKAQAWAEKLARDETLSHSNVRSGAPDCWTALSENVGYGPDVASIEKAYMASAGHRANILNGRWDYVGVGYATRGERIYSVQVFMEGCQ